MSYYMGEPYCDWNDFLLKTLKIIQFTKIDGNLEIMTHT